MPEYERQLREIIEQEEQELRSQRDPDLDAIEQQLEVDDAIDTYVRYIWGTKNDVATQLANGLELKQHNSLPQGWYSTHVGGKEWIAMLAQDYGRSGPVCEVEIFDLPTNQYWVTNDPDLTIGGKLDSNMIISKKRFIPPQNLEITNVFNTEKVSKDYPQFGSEYYWQMQ